MFSTVQVGALSCSHFSSIPLHNNSIFVDAEFVSSSSWFELYFDHVLACGCDLLFCLCNPAVFVVVGCCGTAGVAGNVMYPMFAICGCSCSHLPCIGSREAARECRRKKKEYVKCLENRVAVLENQNKTLIEELKALKDLYCHKAE